MIYTIVKLTLRLFFIVYNRLTIHSTYQITMEQPYIIVSNHISNIDPIYIGVSFPRKLYFMAKKESFRYPIFRWILRYFGAFPVDRSRPDIKAIKTSIDILQKGKVLAIFPQGTRESEKELTEIKQGAAYFAVKTNTPIIPVYIKGTDKVMPKNRNVFKPKKVEIYIGEPIQIPKKRQWKQSEQICIMTRRVMKAINQLSQTSNSSSLTHYKQ